MSDEGRVQRVPGLEMGAIQREMKERESLLWSQVGLKLASGIPLSLAGPLVFAIVMSLVGWANDWAFSYFIVWLLVGLAAFGALAWRLIDRAEHDDVFLDDMMELVSLQPEDHTKDAKLEDIIGQEPRAALDILLGPLAHGPERLYEAWRLMQARKQFTPEKHERAAGLLRDLSTYATGIPWVDLRNPDEDVHRLLSILGYLKATDWISVGRDGQKVWLSSDARKAALTGGDR